MTRRASIEFVESDAPIREPVTKFGGQPVWVGEPAWPRAQETGLPLRFVAQIAIEREMFGDLAGRVAYLFLSDGREDKAVIVQRVQGRAPQLASESGPTLAKSVKTLGGLWRKRVPCEFGVRLSIGADPELATDEEQDEWEEEALDRYSERLFGNKLGGTPYFVQHDRFPDGGTWRLLLQIDTCTTALPFEFDLGDAGYGHVFLSEDGERAEFLWQCH
jgi:uncharacterized protein YwqG